MRKRFLGKSGLEISVLAFGAMTFGESEYAGVGGVMLDDATEQVARAINAGITLFDTADAYSGGESEKVLGAALGDRRKDIVLATKVFGRMGNGAMDRGLSRRHIVEACEASLRRLGTDWIDLYQAHSWDALVPIDETLRAFDDLVHSGKVRYVGCSNYPGWQLMKSLSRSESLGLERYISQQIQYSLLVRDAEHELMPCALSEGLGALIWSPLALGYLTGKYRDGEANGRLKELGILGRLDSDRARATLDTLDSICAARGGETTPAQIALAWLLRRPGVTSILVGARTEQQLVQNIAAADLTLSTEEMESLNAVSEPVPPYPITHQRTSTRDRNPLLPAMIPAED